MSKTYTIRCEENGLRGIEAATAVMLLDQFGTCCDDRQISRDAFETAAQYRAAIKRAQQELREERDFRNGRCGATLA